MGARLAGIDDGFRMFHGLCISSRFFTASTARFPYRLGWLAMRREPFWPEDAGPWGTRPLSITTASLLSWPRCRVWEVLDRIRRLGACFELTVVECGCMAFEDESGICGVGSAA